MKLFMINESGAADVLSKHLPKSHLDLLLRTDVSSLIEGRYCDKTIPFIYSSSLNLNVGDDNDYHMGLIHDNKDLRDDLEGVYVGRDPGVVGRIGYGFKLDKTKYKFQVVACFTPEMHHRHDPSLVAAALQAVSGRALAEPSAVVVDQSNRSDKIMFLGEYLKKHSPAPRSAKIHKSELERRSRYWPTSESAE